MTVEKISLLEQNDRKGEDSYREKLIALLSEDLDFHGQNNSSKLHALHSFPAKFPPQLPRKFISDLTSINDFVLDPMSGSGTTILEALLAHRHGIGFDIDPLAIKIGSAKTAALDSRTVIQTGNEILQQAKLTCANSEDKLKLELENQWDKKTKEFINYWFAPQTQVELFALIKEIKKIRDVDLRNFFELTFSSTIVTKSGGVSLALDLAHTRPHRAKTVTTKAGAMIVGQKAEGETARNLFLTKILRSAFDEFEKRLKANLNELIISAPKTIMTKVMFGNAEKMALPDNTVDLIVTSPPYVSNAIDYMRAHKFTLVWMGYPISKLGEMRGEYIGAEGTERIVFEILPPLTARLISELAKVDERKSRVVHRYYSEMTRVLREMYRVLKPGKAAIVVVGSSIIRGIDTETQNCLAEIGKDIGFEVPKIGVRNLDRNKRMLPAGYKVDLNSQIQNRMHQEFVIGFYKSE